MAIVKKKKKKKGTSYDEVSKAKQLCQCRHLCVKDEELLAARANHLSDLRKDYLTSAYAQISKAFSNWNV